MNILTKVSLKTSQTILSKLRLYWQLTKSLQTGLLVLTGAAGFISSKCPWFNLPAVLSVTGSLFLAISGSTMLNMWYDRDIDARMKRTCWRPLPTKKISPNEALIIGIILSALGVGWALSMSVLYGALIFGGIFFDVVIYTVWLKRRTAWSILWGGISGGMPVLAGRTLGTGEIEWVGILLMLAVLFWIPTHILTFNLRYHNDYVQAGIPVFPSKYGFQTTRRIIAISSIASTISIAAAAYGIGMDIGYLRLIAVLSFGLLALAVGFIFNPSEKMNFGLFKYASIFMMGVMLLIAVEAF